jgi:MraZ protein
MFLGQFRHNIDDKGRLTIPARFRELVIAQGAYIMQGFDQNLMVLTSSAFEAISRKVNHMSMTDPNSRLLRRMIYSTADRVEVDKAGRLLIPLFLRQFAALNGDAVVVGAGDYFEIWSPDFWSTQMDQLQDGDANAHRFVALELSAD